MGILVVLVNEGRMAKKKKVVMLSDHALSTSGVGTQSRHLINGLLDRYPGEWTFRQFGAAIKHTDYETVQVNEDFIIKPIDGFGDQNLLRMTLAIEKPDILFIFTDPRFFIWLFEMEDEIHQICPIVWWHVWDNYPFPDFNSVLYDSTDAVNCHSYLTYEMCKKHFPEKTQWIPHALPNSMFRQLSDTEIESYKSKILGHDRRDHFTAFWINRNAKRKRPNDLLWAWSIFLDNMETKYGHRDAIFLMHTDPRDQEGPNLVAVAQHLGILDTIVFSTERLEFDKINVLHNISDVCINASYAEGFGLATLEAMQTGTPIIALKTGGQTRQVVDHRDGTANGVALDVEFKSMVGSQNVPYIYEDYVSVETIADAFMQIFDAGPEGRKALGQKAKQYASEVFSYDTTIDLWHESMMYQYKNWRSNYQPWTVHTI